MGTPFNASEPRVIIAIAAYKSDDAVLALVERIRQQRVEYDRLIVVDSCGSGVLKNALQELNESSLDYHDSDRNLGSAGNLARRFEIANELGADFMLALNHDAPFSRSEYDALLSAVGGCARIGAVYPLRFEIGRRSFDVTGSMRFPWKFRGVKTIEPGSLVPVYWSSSNGALYSLKPAREGLAFDSTLWMGWEDYAYGALLRAGNWEQYLVERARKDDTYEYLDNRLMGINVTTANKPAWYCYYGVRNLILINIYSRFSLMGISCIALWVPFYIVRIILFPGPARRLPSIRYFAVGLFHGLLNRRGKWRLPA